MTQEIAFKVVYDSDSGLFYVKIPCPHYPEAQPLCCGREISEEEYQIVIGWVFGQYDLTQKPFPNFNEEEWDEIHDTVVDYINLNKDNM